MASEVRRSEAGEAWLRGAAPLAWRLRPDAFPDVSTPAPPRSPPRLFWLLHAAGWTAYFLHGFLSGVAHGKEMGYWKLPLATSAMGFVVTLGLRYLLRALWHLPPWRLLAAVAPAVLAASAAMGMTFLFVLLQWCGDECRPWNAMAYVAYGFSYLYVVLAWVGLYVGARYSRQLRAQTERALAATAMAHQSQLKMLRYQLNPHFLFNTLNAISTLVMDRDTGTATRMVQGLSAFLRHSLDNDPMQRVTLRQELDALRLYLDIEKTRFGDRLKVEIDVDPACHDARLPSLLLQPLVENAIKYAIARQVEGGTLAVRARCRDGMLAVDVEDDGPGMPPATAEAPQRGVGLANTRERLRVLYGDRQHFEVVARQPRGVRVSIRLPFDEAADLPVDEAPATA